MTLCFNFTEVRALLDAACIDVKGNVTPHICICGVKRRNRSYSTFQHFEKTVFLRDGSLWVVEADIELPLRAYPLLYSPSAVHASSSQAAAREYNRVPCSCPPPLPPTIRSDRLSHRSTESRQVSSQKISNLNLGNNKLIVKEFEIFLWKKRHIRLCRDLNPGLSIASWLL